MTYSLDESVDLLGGTMHKVFNVTVGVVVDPLAKETRVLRTDARGPESRGSDVNA